MEGTCGNKFLKGFQNPGNAIVEPWGVGTRGTLFLGKAAGARLFGQDALGTLDRRLVSRFLRRHTCT